MIVATPHEVFVDFAQPLSRIPLVRAQRSTTLLAEIAVLRAMGHGAAYETLVGARGRKLLEAVAGTWIEMPEMVVHYDACERLGLSAAQQVQFGADAAGRIFGTLLGTAVKLARSAGASPWTFFENVGRFWSRGYEGGGLRVLRLGPKEARVDLAGNPLFQREFFRNGFRGYALAMLGLFCTRVWVREEAPSRGVSATYRGQWA
jgi:hypothetical protein